MTIDIEVNPHWVIIEKTRIERPARVSPAQWIDMWEDFRELYAYNLKVYRDLIT
jgi:hypothetical protein